MKKICSVAVQKEYLSISDADICNSALHESAMMRAMDCETPATFNKGSAMTPKLSIDMEDVELLKDAQPLNDYLVSGKIDDIESSTTKSDSELIASDENESNDTKRSKHGKGMRRKTLVFVATLLLATGTVVGIALNQDTIKNLFFPSTITSQASMKPPAHDSAIDAVITSSKSTAHSPLNDTIDTAIPASNITAQLPPLNTDSVNHNSTSTTQFPSLSSFIPPKASSHLNELFEENDHQGIPKVLETYLGTPVSATLVRNIVSPKHQEKGVDIIDSPEW